MNKLRLIAIIASIYIAGARADAVPLPEKLNAHLEALIQHPHRLDAEIEVIEIFELWDLLGPEPIMATLGQVIDHPKLPIRVKERAQHLQAQGHLRMGNRDVARKSYEERGFDSFSDADSDSLSGWWVAGPFDNEGGTGVDVAFSPESKPTAALDATMPMTGKDGPVFWRIAPKQIFHMGYTHLNTMFESVLNTCVYAATSVMSPKKGNAVLRIGAGGAVRAYWNGALALADTAAAYNHPDPDRLSASVRVRQGANRILIKVCTEAGANLGFFVRLTDHRMQPWPLTLQSDPSGHFKTQIAMGPAGKALPSPLERLTKWASRSKNNPAALYAAARYISKTKSSNPNAVLARDDARAACHLNGASQNCLLWASLALDRNERRTALSSIDAQASKTRPVLLAWAAFEKDGHDPIKARPYIQRALALDPDDITAACLEVEVLAAQGFVQTANQRVQALVKKFPGCPKVLKLAMSLAAMGGRREDERIFAKRILGTRFDDRSSHELLARSALARSDRKSMEYHLQALSQLTPINTDGLLFESEMRERAGDPQGAVRALKARTKLIPSDPDAWQDFGLFLRRQGTGNAGITELSRALDLRPQDTWLSDYLGFHRTEPGFASPYWVSPDDFLAQRSTSSRGNGARYLVDQTVTRVFESGLAHRARQIAVEITSREAAKEWRQYSVSLSPDRQRFKLYEARVFHADGSVENSVARGIVPISEPWYRLYYDVVAEVIEFPLLTPGDVIEVRYRLDDTAKRNLFSDYFGDFAFIQEDIPKTLWRYVLIAPPTRDLYFNDDMLSNNNVKRNLKRTGKTKRWIFETTSTPALRREHRMPGITASATYFHASTYPSFEALGKWYQGLIRHSLIPDARIKEKAGALTRGLKTDIQKVHAIYQWVVTTTRYVGLEFGIHGYKPYRVPLVVSRGFGDCKDKAALLVSMLREVDIEAEFALVRTRDLGPIDDQLASLAVFNHAIVYLPGLDLWLDGTAEHFGIDAVPFADQDTPALRIRDDQAIFGLTPVMPPSKNSTESDVVITLHPNGEATMRARALISGPSAAAFRQQLEVPQTRKDRFESALARRFPGSSVEALDIGSLLDLSKKVSYQYTAHVPSYAQKIKEQLEIPIDTPLGLTDDYGRLGSRIHDLIVGPTRIAKRRAIIHLPPGYSVGTLPTAVNMQTQFGRLSVGISQQQNAIHLDRTFELSVHRVLRDDYPRFVDFIQRVDQTLASRVRLKRNK
ncbi:MAG: DUF3857 domain-containing protein [Myxococcota bacterium]|nr:DUF3857 domain-containing protein [Myxococcota bacterium]